MHRPASRTRSTPSRSRFRRRLARASLLAGALAVGVGALAACEPAPEPDTYVSLGDSNMAGPVILPPDLSKPGCLRSTSNGPHLAAPRLPVDRFVDVSCSSAQTRDLYAPQHLPDGSTAAPQLDVVDARAKVITLGIGGNDVGFGEVVQTCVSRAAQLQECRSQYVREGRDLLAERIAAFGADLEAALDAIRDRAPRAEVLVLGYLPILPATGEWCPAYVPVLPSDLTYLRTTQERLNAEIRRRAEAGGATFVPGIADRVGRDACQAPGVKWVEGLVPAGDAAPLHSNAAAHRAFAELIVATAEEVLAG